jgi:LysR family glycine cleavage system transcriptional activator
MTQAAISYQIKLLEERLGIALFRRERRRVVLTDAGRRIAAQLTIAFDGMDAAFATARQDDAAQLVITTTKTFANAWLAWRLGGFQMGYPDMSVRLSTGEEIADLNSGAADIAIRSGLGDWPGLVCEKLMTIDFTPMCSPDFLQRFPLRSPADVTHVPRINPQDLWWSIWLQEAGVDMPECPARAGVLLDSQADEGHAAIAGQAMAMLTPFFWRQGIANGRLVAPFAQISSRGFGYWLVYPEHRRHVPKLRRFRDWLIAEIALDRAADSHTGHPQPGPLSAGGR